MTVVNSCGSVFTLTKVGLLLAFALGHDACTADVDGYDRLFGADGSTATWSLSFLGMSFMSRGDD